MDEWDILGRPEGGMASLGEVEVKEAERDEGENEDNEFHPHFEFYSGYKFDKLVLSQVHKF